MRELIELIMRRDGISFNEAANIVEECQREITTAIEWGASYDEVTDILADYLGLEPDYLDVLMF